MTDDWAWCIMILHYPSGKEIMNLLRSKIERCLTSLCNQKGHLMFCLHVKRDDSLLLKVGSYMNDIYDIFYDLTF